MIVWLLSWLCAATIPVPAPASLVELRTQASRTSQEVRRSCSGENKADPALCVAALVQHLAVQKQILAAKQIQGEAAGRDARMVCQSLEQLSRTEESRSSFRPALQYAQEAQVCFAQTGDQEQVMQIARQTASLHATLGEPEQGLAVLTAAAPLFDPIIKKATSADERQGILYQKALTETVRSSLEEQMDDLPSALHDMERALTFFAKYRADYEPQYVGTLNNLATLHIALGQYQSALALYARFFQGIHRLQNPSWVAGALDNQGIIYKQLGDFERAGRSYQRALSIAQAQKDLASEAIILANQGNLFIETGDLPAAEAALQRALDLTRSSGAQSGSVEIAMGWLLRQKGDRTKAQKIFASLDYQEGLGLLALDRKTPDKALSHFQTGLTRAQATQRIEFLFANHTGCGEAYRQMKDWPAAEGSYRKAMEALEDQRERLAPAERRKFFAASFHGFARTAPYEGLVEVLLAQGKLEEAFRISEMLKARALADTLGASPRDVRLPESLQLLENALDHDLRRLHKRRDRMFRLKDAAGLGECDRLLQAARTRKRELISQVRQKSPRYAALRYPDPARPADIQLPSDTALVVYEVMENETAIFTLQRGKVAVDRVPVQRRDLDREIRALSDSFRKITSKRDLERVDVAGAHRLETQLVAPVRTRLADGVRRVILVPDETLGLLSFEALVTRVAQAGKGMGYLLDDIEILYAPSATSLVLQRPARVGGNSATYFLGDPVFSCRDSRWPRAAERRSVATTSSELSTMGIAGLYDRTLGAGPGCAEAGWPRLAKTAALGGHLDNFFPGKVQKRLGLTATETGLGQTNLSAFRYLVFATHGAQGDGLPVGEPALVLTQVGNADADDGFLTQSEASTMVLDADVVALVACDTGVGHLQRGEGVLGLGRAFQHAGARNVLVSLWPVAEDATVRLISNFFSHVRNGAIPSLALKQAKLDLRAQGFEHPFYWAPFILVGTN